MVYVAVGFGCPHSNAPDSVYYKEGLNGSLENEGMKTFLFCFKDLFLFYVYRCFTHKSVHCCVQDLRRPEEAVRSSGTGVTDSCGLSCGCWESNPGPLEEQLVL